LPLEYRNNDVRLALTTMRDTVDAFQIQRSAMCLSVTLDDSDSAELTRIEVELDLSVAWMIRRAI